MTDKPHTADLAGHTPGDWYADGRDVRGAGSWTVAQAFHTPDGKVFQNAKLLAAAPALLEALQMAVEDATGNPNVWFYKARAAIRLATGAEQ